MKLKLLALLLTAGLFTACNGQYDDEADAKVAAAYEKPAQVVAEVKPVEAVVEEATEVAAPKVAPDGGVLHTVKMLNHGAGGIMVFEPGFLKINKGDTVYFEATDAGHDAVSSFAPGDPWRVGFQGGKVTFNDEGIHIYYCTPHKSMAMYGVIQVGEAVNKEAAMKSAKASEAGFAMNQGRLMNYMDQIQ